MTTHPLTRPTRHQERYLSHLHSLAANADPPDPDAWLAFLCHRCDQPFKFQGIARHCTRCISQAAAAGVIGSELIGEVSGC